MVKVLGASPNVRQRARENYEAAMFTDTAAIYRIISATPNTDFGTTKVFELLDIVGANFWSLTGRDALVLGRLDVKAEGTVSVPALTDITELDEIVYTETETGDIHHFSVAFVHDRSRPLTQNVAVTEFKFQPQQ